MTALTPKQQAELAQLYRETFRSLYAYALSALRDPALAEEAVQETFFIACAKIDYLLESPNPRGWLTLTVRNVTRNLRVRERKRAAQVSLSATQEDPVGEEDVFLRPELLYKSYVSEEELALLSRVGIDGYTIQEASEQFGISVEAGKKQEQRAKKKFQKQFEKDF